MSQPDNSKLATASSPIRMRVQGMDCAKDAAEIERAARSAGVAEGDVKVSAATHIMTLWIADGDLPKVRPALDATGYGFEKIEDGDPYAHQASEALKLIENEYSRRTRSR